MGSPDRNASEARLTESITDMTLFGAQAKGNASRLGQALWRNIDLINNDPASWYPRTETRKTTGTRSAFHRLTPFCLGWLVLSVPKAYQRIECTGRWLNHTREVELNLQRSKNELPLDINNKLEPEAVQSETEIVMKPATYIDDIKPARDRLYKATYAAGMVLNGPEVERVIRILDQMAGEPPAS